MEVSSLYSFCSLWRSVCSPHLRLFLSKSSCSRCGNRSLTIAGYGPITITFPFPKWSLTGKTGIHHAIVGLKLVLKRLQLPDFAVLKAIDNSGDAARVAFENAAYKTQITFATISAKVTSLSVYLFRSAFSTFWGLLLGLLR